MRRASLAAAFFLLAAGALFTPLHAGSDTLRDVQTSKHYKKMDHPLLPRNLINERWFVKDSNFAKLFFNIDGGQLLLLDWSGEAALGLASGEAERLWKTEYVGIRRSYSTKEGVNLDLQILVPHPMFLDTTQLGLVKGFLELEPPALKVVYIDEVDIRGFAGKLYHREDKACSLVLRLVKGTLINLETKSCDHKDDLLEFMNVVDLKRLNEKLES